MGESWGMKRLNVKEAIERALAEKDVFHTGNITEMTGLSRQAVQPRLRELVRKGELAVVGQGRTAGYRSTGKVTLFESSYRPEGLEEDAVWREMRQRLEPLEEVAVLAGHVHRGRWNRDLSADPRLVLPGRLASVPAGPIRMSA